jgi:hypothetical protein
MGGSRLVHFEGYRRNLKVPAERGPSSRALLAMSVAAWMQVLLPAPAVLAQPAEYSGAEIRARVVDIETQEPLEGVFVIARWDLDQSLSRERKPLHIMETVTDAKGEFHFPRWGPKPRPPFTRLWGGDPRLVFFKPGYEPVYRVNPTAPDDSAVRVSRWHGRVIPAKRFRGTPEQWASFLSVLQTTLNWGATSHDFPYRTNDHWKYYPRTILAILAERDQMSESIRHLVSDLESWDITEEQLRAVSGRKGISR